jgi:hypothetical protein
MKKLLAVFLFLSLLVLPLTVRAQPVVSAVCVVCGILNMIKTIVLAIGLGIAVILLVIGGIQYATAGSNMDKAANAKRLLINAVIGIAIVFAAAFILSLIQGTLVDAGIGFWIFVNPCEVSCGYY